MPQRPNPVWTHSQSLARGLLLAGVLGSLGCATLPYEGPLPDGVTVAEFAATTPNAPFAWSPSGVEVALVRDEKMRILISFNRLTGEAEFEEETDAARP